MYTVVAYMPSLNHLFVLPFVFDGDWRMNEWMDEWTNFEEENNTL